MRILLACLLFACGSAVGIAVARRKRRTEQLFVALERACAVLQTEIAYRRPDLPSLLGTVDVGSAPLKRIFRAYVQELGSPENTGSAAVCREAGLTEQETQELLNFLSRLGTSDAESQIRLITDFRAVLAREIQLRTERNRVDAPLAIKLGILAGIALGILVV